MGSNTKRLRSGYTTGACAAAAAKAAVQLLLGAGAQRRGRTEGEKENSITPGNPEFRTRGVEIPFPDGSRVIFRVHGSGVREGGRAAWASVVKDAGDDPDVTNGAEIVAEVSWKADTDMSGKKAIWIKGGDGVGRITKPGLAVPVGEPAINPVPRRMIQEAVQEAVKEIGRDVEVIISVKDGESLAKKTLNSRLGIVGGLSILGTTGIVKPLSADAWTATISASLDVALAAGCREVVLSSGRTSEKAHQKRYNFPEEAYVMMGDYLEYSLKEADSRRFSRIHLCAQWAKMLKIAMAVPQTHVRHGAIGMARAIALLKELNISVPGDAPFNTAREIFDFIIASDPAAHEKFSRVCGSAREYAEHTATATPVTAHLVSYGGEIIAENG